VQQYIQRERLARACHLLTHSSLAIKSIAIETGIPQRVCMKGFSQFRSLLGDKGQRLGQVVFAQGGLEIGK
jgi:transcriptional regulator GlxA family with amidase domain